VYLYPRGLRGYFPTAPMYEAVNDNRYILEQILLVPGRVPSHADRGFAGASCICLDQRAVVAVRYSGTRYYG
jgi:hypothetical protein